MKTKTQKNLLKSALLIAIVSVASTACFADDSNDLGNLQPGTELAFHLKGFIPGSNDSYEEAHVLMGRSSLMECSLEFKSSSQDRQIDADVSVTVRRAKHNGEQYRINGDFVIKGIPQDGDVYISCYPIDHYGQYADYDVSLNIGNFRSFIQQLGGTIQTPDVLSPDKF